MKLETIFPKPKRLTLGPHPDYYPDKEHFPELCWGGGYYDCYMCHKLTAYRVWLKNEGGDSYYALVCSTECYEEATETKPKWPEAPVKPVEAEAPKPELVVAPEPEVSKAPIEAEPEEEEHPELTPVPEGTELPKPKLTKEMIQKLLEKKK